MRSNDFVDKAYTALPRRCKLMTETIQQFVEPRQRLRVLDLGCGTGRQLLELASVLPNADLTGVDISEVNVRLADAQDERAALGSRITFVATDYMTFQAEPFDVILSDSTLQNIDAPTDALLAKLSADLRMGGLLVSSMPYGCLYNHALWGTRRVLRALRCRLTDRLLFAVAWWLHGDALSEEAVRERVHYMYLLPRCYEGRALQNALEKRHGLQLTSRQPVSHASIAQPKHVLKVYRKRR